MHLGCVYFQYNILPSYFYNQWQTFFTTKKNRLDFFNSHILVWGGPFECWGVQRYISANCSQFPLAVEARLVYPLHRDMALPREACRSHLPFHRNPWANTSQQPARRTTERGEKLTSNTDISIIYLVASELKDPIWHSSEWQIGSFSSEATICYLKIYKYILYRYIYMYL